MSSVDIGRAPMTSRLLLPISILLAGVGYFAPWISHDVSGLVITGIDLGEFVKFLPAVRTGEVQVWREVFYVPLLALALTCALSAYRSEFDFPGWLRSVLLSIALVATLNFLPPAWTPDRMLLPEFRLQLVALLACLALIAFSPALGHIPVRLYQALVVSVCLAALVLPAVEVGDILPLIRDLYLQPLAPDFGLYLLMSALVGVSASVGLMTTSAGTLSATGLASVSERQAANGSNHE